MYFHGLFFPSSKNKKNRTLSEPTLFALDICNLAWRKLQKLVNSLCPKLCSRLAKEKRTCKIVFHFLFMTFDCQIWGKPLNKHYCLRWDPQITIARCSLKNKDEEEKKSKRWQNKHCSQNPILPLQFPIPITQKTPGIWSPFLCQLRADKQKLKICFILIPIAKSRTSIK